METLLNINLTKLSPAPAPSEDDRTLAHSKKKAATDDREYRWHPPRHARDPQFFNPRVPLPLTHDKQPLRIHKPSFVMSFVTQKTRCITIFII
ncbi:unnamed protein product [Colias eurytheme]|nr:unnamed protein product [Colias eurytheme]